jgi:hypothetical protein
VEQVATIQVPGENKRLNNFKRILLICQASITFTVCFYFLFEDSIVRTLSHYLPSDEGKSVKFYYDLFRLGITELLWLSLIFIIAIVLYSKSSLLYRLDRLERAAILNHKRISYGLILLCGIATVVVAVAVLQQFPNSSDEYVYVYQAETLSSGKLYYKAPPVEDSFGFNHIAEKDGIAVGRFPPGWPLVLSLFLFLGIPAALANPLLAIVSLFVFFRLASKIYNQHVALWGLVLLACSGFFLFNSGSFFSHTVCMLEGLLMVYFFYEYLQTKKPWHAILTGVFLSLIFLTRYYTAFLFFLPMACYLFHRQKLKALLTFCYIGLGALPFVVFLLYYNYSITGDALTPVTVWAYADESLGFVNGHTLAKGVEHIIRRLIMFMYWASPILLFLYFFYLIKKVRSSTLRVLSPEDYLFLLLIVGYCFYYEIGGNQYGPRFYYEAFPFVILFVLNQIFSRGAYWAKVLLYAGVIVMLIKIPLIAHREYKIIRERTDVYQKVQRAGLTNAVVILKSGTGVIRPMPTGDLTRNDAEFRNEVLYAVDNVEFNDELLRYFRDRNIYEYVRKPGHAEGKLIRIR